MVNASLKGSKDKTLAFMSFFIDLYGDHTEHIQKTKSCSSRNSFCQNQIGSVSGSDILFSSFKLQTQALLANIREVEPEFYQNTLKFYEQLQRLRSQDLSHECVVCQLDLDEYDQSYQLPRCGHDQFHKECIDNWLKVQNVCPICRDLF